MLMFRALARFSTALGRLAEIQAQRKTTLAEINQQYFKVPRFDLGRVEAEHAELMGCVHQVMQNMYK